MMKQIKKMAILLLVGISIFSLTQAGNKPNSKFGGVQVGTITYSFLSMPDQSLPAILGYAAQAGVSSIELMGNTVESYAGIPVTEDAEVLKKWRTSVSMDKFKEIRKMAQKEGLKIHILKLGSSKWSDEEIDYAFNVCKVLGAKGISMEVSKEAAKRLQPFAEKHNLYVIFHNHGQPADPNFSFDEVLALGSMMMLNFDAGHYYGFTGKNPCDLIERLHDRIFSLHLKDKTGPDSSTPNRNYPFGEGETPLKDILTMIKANKWPIYCDIELEYKKPEGSDSVKEVAKCVKYCEAILNEKE